MENFGLNSIFFVFCSLNSFFLFCIFCLIYFFIFFIIFKRLDRGKFEECKTIVLSQQNNEELWKSIKFKIFDVPNLNENEKGKL